MQVASYNKYRFRGKELMTQRCPSCRGNVEVKVFECKLHTYCSEAKPVWQENDGRYHVCAVCPDRGICTGEERDDLNRMRRLLDRLRSELAPAAAPQALLGPISVAGATMQSVLELSDPRVVVVDGAALEAECQAMISLARERLSRSPVVGQAASPARTSQGCFVSQKESEIAAAMTQRASVLARRPPSCCEFVQVLRYGPGEKYDPHHDWFADASNQADGGQRVATVMIYLSACIGGETVFPKLGLAVAPSLGRAVGFCYEQENPLLFHGGNPPRGGEKWTAVCWFRQRPRSNQ